MLGPEARAGAGRALSARERHKINDNGAPKAFRRAGFMSKQRLYRITFTNQGQVYEIYARNVSHGGLLGFVEVEGLVFGEKSSVVLDPAEEKLKTEFGNVARTFVPVHAVIRIDEVSKPGVAKISPLPEGVSGKVTPFPTFTKGKDR
jgi:hypothetical protein